MATAASPAGPDVETLTTAFRQVHSPYESGSSYTKTTYISGEARGRFERLNPSDAIIVNICLKSLLAHSAAVKDDCPLESLCPDFEAKRGAQQILDSDGYIYSQKKSRDTALTSTKYNPPTKCKCHIYLVPSRQLPHSGYTAPQPLCISNMPKLLPLRTSSYLPPAPRHAEKSPSSSTTGRLRGVLNGD
ncbi:hypothetical protein ACHWQZ_G000723 [Mnemiopsis leidyi]